MIDLAYKVEGTFGSAPFEDISLDFCFQCPPCEHNGYEIFQFWVC